MICPKCVFLSPDLQLCEDCQALMDMEKALTEEDVEYYRRGPDGMYYKLDKYDNFVVSTNNTHGKAVK